MDQPPKKSSRDIYTNKVLEKYRNFENITRGGLAEHYFNNLESILLQNGVGHLRDKNKKVLEIGSGNAEFLNFSRQQGVNITGVDINPRGSNGDSQVIARLEHLPYRDNSFEVIYSNSVFDSGVYNQHPELMMKEICRVLKHGGIFVGFETNADLHPVEGLTLVTGSHYEYVFKKS